MDINTRLSSKDIFRLQAIAHRLYLMSDKTAFVEPKTILLNCESIAELHWWYSMLTKKCNE